MIDLLGPSNQHNLRNLSRNVSKSSASSYSMTFLQDVIIHHLDIRVFLMTVKRSLFRRTLPYNAHGHAVRSVHQTTYNKYWTNANILCKNNNRRNNQDLPGTIPTTPTIQQQKTRHCHNARSEHKTKQKNNLVQR